MKKILILCICCFLVGCTSQEAVQPIDETGKAIIVDQIGWVGQYQKEDILLTISYDNEYSEGFAFEIEKGVEGFGEYARFQSR